MTGHRCVVPGCKSGYDSSKTKHHLFTVPKEPGRLEQWKKALPRKSSEIKPKQIVCKIHFQNEHIICKKVAKIVEVSNILD